MKSTDVFWSKASEKTMEAAIMCDYSADGRALLHFTSGVILYPRVAITFCGNIMAARSHLWCFINCRSVSPLFISFLLCLRNVLIQTVFHYESSLNVPRCPLKNTYPQLKNVRPNVIAVNFFLIISSLEGNVLLLKQIH